jgi:hypothetical protein
MSQESTKRAYFLFQEPPSQMGDRMDRARIRAGPTSR